MTHRNLIMPTKRCNAIDSTVFFKRLQETQKKKFNPFNFFSAKNSRIIGLLFIALSILIIAAAIISGKLFALIFAAFSLIIGIALLID